MGARLRLFGTKHKKMLIALGLFIVVRLLLFQLCSSYDPLNPEVVRSKERADAAKQYILSFGRAAPVFLIMLQVVQVIVFPIPGQAPGFAGGYVFGWQWGVTYTMLGLTVGSWLVFVLSRTLGRRFVEKVNGAEALKDFAALFVPQASTSGRLYEKAKEGVSAHGLLTFFLIMLLPALPDALVCYIAGLTRIPIWQLMIATIVGRFPGMLFLSMVGAGFSKAESNVVFLVCIALTVGCTGLYVWKKPHIDARMKKVVFRPSAQ